MNDIEIEVKTGKHTLDYEPEKSVKMMSEALQQANVVSGKFLLWLGKKTKGSPHRKGVRFTSWKKNVFTGTIQTGDNSSCFIFMLKVSREVNAAHLFSYLKGINSGVKEQLVEEETPPEASEEPEKTISESTPLEEARVQNRKKIFKSAAFLKGEESRKIFASYILEGFSRKKARFFSVSELRKLMVKRALVNEDVSFQSIYRFCQQAASKKFFQRVVKKGYRFVYYALAEEYLTEVKKKRDKDIEKTSDQAARLKVKPQKSLAELHKKLKQLRQKEKEVLQTLKQIKTEEKALKKEIYEIIEM